MNVWCMPHFKMVTLEQNYDILDRCCRRKEETDDNETGRRNNGSSNNGDPRICDRY